MRTIETELEEYLKERESTDNELLKFWQAKKMKYPHLYKIVVLYAHIPFTEVNVERLFSNVKFLLNPLRLSLADRTINDIMLIRMNIKLFENKVLPLSLS